MNLYHKAVVGSGLVLTSMQVSAQGAYDSITGAVDLSEGQTAGIAVAALFAGLYGALIAGGIVVDVIRKRGNAS